jgi:hypothetical protein
MSVATNEYSTSLELFRCRNPLIQEIKCDTLFSVNQQ